MKFYHQRILNIILFISLSAIGFNAQAQMRTNGNTTNNAETQHVFLDASSYSTDFGTNVGKGIGFPRTDLTQWVFKTTVLDGVEFETAYDGLIIYNTGTGQTIAGQGIQVDVQPGFYYFQNPGATDSITNGQWVLIGEDAASQYAWSLEGNAGTNSTTTFLGTTDAQDLIVKTNNAERLRITDNGNVGIGVLDPTTLLDVNGQARIRTLPAGVASDQVVTADASGNLRKRTFAAIGSDDQNISGSGLSGTTLTIGIEGGSNETVDLISLRDGDAWGVTGENLTSAISRSGNVGIGVVTPNQVLDLNGTTLIRNGGLSNATTGNEQLLFSFDGGSFFKQGIRTRHAGGEDLGNAIDFYTWDQGTDSADDNPSLLGMSVTAGRVGIATLIPSQALDVNGQARIRTLPAGVATDQVVTADASGNLRKITLGSPILGTDDQNISGLNFNSTTNILTVGIENGSSDTVNLSALAGAGADGDAWGVTGENLTSAISRTGNVGIGGASGSEKLKVTGDFYNTGGAKLVVQGGVDGGSNRGIFMWTNANTDWGINLASSGAGKSLGGGNATTGVGFTSHSLRFRAFDSSSNGVIFENSNEELLASIRGSDGLSYFAGDMGIGVSPTAKLDVNGQARIRTLPAGAATDQVVTADANGNLRKQALASIGSDDQNISGSGLSGTTLTIGIEGGNNETVELSSLQDGTGTDDQNISGSGLSGTTLTIGIEGGNNETVELSSLRDGDAWGVTGEDLTSAISRSGNVGIGATPTAKLDVNGSLRVRDLPNLNGANTDQILTVDNTGVVNSRPDWKDIAIQVTGLSETITSGRGESYFVVGEEHHEKSIRQIAYAIFTYGTYAADDVLVTIRRKTRNNGSIQTLTSNVDIGRLSLSYSGTPNLIQLANGTAKSYSHYDFSAATFPTIANLQLREGDIIFVDVVTKSGITHKGLSVTLSLN